MDTSTQRQHQLLARLNRIPVWPYSNMIILIVGIGFFFAFFDIITIGLAIPILVKQFDSTVSTAMWSITSGLIGYIIGSFLDSRLSDIFGRRLALVLSMLFFSIGSILSATSPNMEWLIFWRFIIGMGIGAEIANVTTYMGELAPSKTRGRYTSIAVCMAFIGFAIVPFVALWLLPSYAWGWRAIFLIGGIGGFVVLFARRHLPDSIRWDIHKGYLDTAEQKLADAERLAERKMNKPLDEPVMDDTAIIPSDKSSFTALLKPAHLKYVIFFVLVWAFYYLGNYAWLTLSEKLFLLEGFDLSNSLLIVSINSLGFILGSVIAIFIGDHFERKYTLISTLAVWVISLAIIAWWHDLYAIYLFGFIATTTISLFIPLAYTYTAEHFPTRFRATAVSISDGLGHIGGAFCGQIVFAVYGLFKASGHGVNAAFMVILLSGLITLVLLCFGRKLTKSHLVN